MLTSANKQTLSARRLTSFVDETFGTGRVSSKFRTVFSRTTRIPEVQEIGRTMFEEFPNHKVTNEFRALADELEDRLKALALETPSSPTLEIVHA